VISAFSAVTGKITALLKLSGYGMFFNIIPDSMENGFKNRIFTASVIALSIMINVHCSINMAMDKGKNRYFVAAINILLTC